MTNLQLKDHIEQILSFIADDIEVSQSADAQFDKSRGLVGRSDESETAAEVHGALRHDDGYNVMEMVSEYRALRASVIKLWTTENKVLTDNDVLELTRFNEAIDQALAESVVKFSQKVDQSKDLLLGVLGHDIRSPLATIHMSAELLRKMDSPNERAKALITQIETSTMRVRNIVTDLLDLAKARLGTGIPLSRSAMSLSDLCVGIVDEMRIQHPDRAFNLTIAPDIRGYWDNVRLGQVLSNLLNNAIQYGKPGSPISVRLEDGPSSVTLAVHNEGDPIPRTHLESIFESFSRVGSPEGTVRKPHNLGLGLFISREVVNAHGGRIHATSEAKEGTTLTIMLPKADS